MSSKPKCDINLFIDMEPARGLMIGAVYIVAIKENIWVNENLHVSSLHSKQKVVLII